MGYSPYQLVSRISEPSTVWARCFCCFGDPFLWRCSYDLKDITFRKNHRDLPIFLAKSFPTYQTAIFTHQNPRSSNCVWNEYSPKVQQLKPLKIKDGKGRPFLLLWVLVTFGGRTVKLQVKLRVTWESCLRRLLGKKTKRLGSIKK